MRFARHSQPLAAAAARRRRRALPAFSLVEAIVASGIVALMLVASLNLLAGAARTRAADSGHRTGLMLANQLMAEILQQPYKDETPLNLTFGPEVGESGTTRGGFDDVDDYSGFQEKPPRLKDGTALPGYDAWKRKVKVTWVQPGSLASSLVDTGLVLIEVRSVDAVGRETAVWALRSTYMVPDPPPSGSTSLLWTGIELETGGDTPRRSTGGVSVITRPATP